MPGIIEDHEERLQILEAARRGVNTEITTRIDQFSAELEAQSRRLTLMEANHTGLQHNEIQALGRRVTQVETRVNTTIDDAAAKIDALGVDTRAWVDEIKAEFRQQLSEVRLEWINDLTREATYVTGEIRDIVAHIDLLDDWYMRHATWDAQPWYVRWWRRIKGESP